MVLLYIKTGKIEIISSPTDLWLRNLHHKEYTFKNLDA